MPNYMLPDCNNLRYLALSGMHIAQKTTQGYASASFEPLFNISDFRIVRSHQWQSSSPPSKICCLYEFLLLHRMLSRHKLPSSSSPITLTYLNGLDLDEDPAGLLWVFDNFTLTEQQKYARVVTRLSGMSRDEHLGLFAALRRPQAIGQFLQTAQSLSIEVTVLTYERHTWPSRPRARGATIEKSPLLTTLPSWKYCWHQIYRIPILAKSNRKRLRRRYSQTCLNASSGQVCAT